MFVLSNFVFYALPGFLKIFCEKLDVAGRGPLCNSDEYPLATHSSHPVVFGTFFPLVPGSN